MKIKKFISIALICSLALNPLEGFAFTDEEYKNNKSTVNDQSTSPEEDLKNLKNLQLELETKIEELKKLREKKLNDQQILKDAQIKVLEAENKKLREKIENLNASQKDSKMKSDNNKNSKPQEGSNACAAFLASVIVSAYAVCLFNVYSYAGTCIINAASNFLRIWTKRFLDPNMTNKNLQN